MGWEQRGNQSYFYRKERTEGSVRSVYVGHGEFAVLIVQFEAMKREERVAQQVEQRQERRGVAALDQTIDRLAQLSTTLTEAVLLTAGFHQHKRQWRKKRI